MKYFRNKASTLVATGALVLSSLALTPKAQADICLTVEVCGTACAFGVCVTVCASATVCVGLEEQAV